jgi:hypothetical protein
MGQSRTSVCLTAELEVTGLWSIVESLLTYISIIQLVRGHKKGQYSFPTKHNLTNYWSSSGAGSFLGPAGESNLDKCNFNFSWYGLINNDSF